MIWLDTFYSLKLTITLVTPFEKHKSSAFAISTNYLLEGVGYNIMALF